MLRFGFQIYLDMEKCMNIWHRKEKYLLIHLIVDFMDLWYYLEMLKMFCLKLFYLGNWCKIFSTRNGFEDFENIVDIWLLKYLLKLLWSKLYILNTFTLWAFDVGLPLCYDVDDYPVFVTMSLCRVITPSSWRQARLEAPTLHDMGKSLSVWVRLPPIRPKDHMQKGYCVTRHSMLLMGGRGKSLSVWVRLGKAKRPHTKEILHDALFSTAHGGDR